MSERCPHTTVVGVTRDQCSICRGATPRIVTRDEATGVLMIDGVPLERAFHPPPEGRTSPAARRRARPRSRKPSPVPPSNSGEESN